MEKVLLTVLDAFAGIFRLLGADYEQVRAIVAIKIVMDNRRQLVGFQKKTKESGNTFWQTVFAYIIFGVFVGFLLSAIPSFRFAMTVFFSYLMVMIVMTLITDFSSILLDTSDNTIILPRPVDGRTLFVARVTHIMLYLGQLAVGLSIVPSMVVLFMHGWVVLLAFGAGVVLAIVTAVFITNAFYLLVMQFSSEEKLKNIINYFQIIMAVAVMGSYQILPRMMGKFTGELFEIDLSAWSLLVPPLWMAGALEMVKLHLFDGLHLALTASALVVPFAGMYVVNKFLTPVFNRKLSALSGDMEASKVKKVVVQRAALPSRRWFTASSVEQGAFDVVSKLLSRDRKIRLKIYPAYGYVLILTFIFIFRSKDSLASTMAHLSESNYHLVLIYLMFMVQQVACHEIPYSDDFKASWIYFSAPLAAPGEILSGALKAIFVRLFVPGYTVVSVIVVYVWGWRVWPDLLFGLFNNMIMVFFLVMFSKRYLPFSVAPSLRSQSGNLARGLLTGLMIGLLGLIHFGITYKPIVLLAAIPAQLVVLYFTHRDYKQTSWERLTL
jgi:ABC-2 type transport system permease protein